MDTVAADKTHRGHAIIEQVHADLKSGPARAPALRGVHREQRLARPRRDRVQPHPRRRDSSPTEAGRLARATTATIRRTLIHVPARLARSARRITLHLPEAWPWQTAFDRLFTATHAPPPAAAS